jgi:integrase/recombinase XerC
VTRTRARSRAESAQAPEPPRSEGTPDDPRLATRNAFLDHLALERRLSPATRRNYARDIATLFALHPGLALEAFEVQHVRRAVATLHARGLQPGTLGRALSAWRTFFRWLARQHRLRVDPCSGVRAPKAGRPLPKALSPDAAARLLDAPAATPLELQDRAMFELFYSSGLRLAELVALDLEAGAAIVRDGEVTVTGKGRRTRAVPVGSVARTAVAAWLAARPSTTPASQALFVGARGRRVHPGVVRARLARQARRAGLEQHVHPHVLRHSFASHLLQSSGDLRAVQELLGHANIATTQVYTHLDFQHLARAYDQAHPRARRK